MADSKDWDKAGAGGERIFFTSDTHFAHKNIKKFCPTTRLGNDIGEHDEMLIRNWNAVVRPIDRVYHLGDFCFGNAEYAGKVLSRLMGNIHFIYGNHDNVLKNNAVLRQRFTWVGDYKEIDLPIPGSQMRVSGSDFSKTHKVVLFHFPIFEWNRMHHGAFHFYGHVHGSVTIPGRAQDVGVDTRPAGSYMTLWPWEELYQQLMKREVRGHHDVKKGL
jgi:calcineurin-like phosphoesterase family protein